MDVPRPVKRLMAGYREAESSVMRAVCERFGLAPNEPASVREADTRMLAMKMRDLMAAPQVPWGSLAAVEPYRARIDPVLPRKAERAFLDRLLTLVGQAA